MIIKNKKAKENNSGGFWFFIALLVIGLIIYIVVNVGPTLLYFISMLSAVCFVIGLIGVIATINSGDTPPIFFYLLFGGLVVCIFTWWAGSSLDGYITNSETLSYFKSAK